MAVNLAAPKAPAPVAGARWATASAAIKQPNQTDVAVLALPRGSTVSAVFTRNAFAAAPVTVAREHMQQTGPRALIVNSGNANAGTGEQGLADARRCCEAVARQLDLDSEQVLPFSTGVIGERLPLARLQDALQNLDGLSETAWLDAAEAIMTTDTVAKAASRSVDITVEDGRTQTVTLTGIAKGSGMIRPDMATMLGFIATDARVEQSHLDHTLREAVNGSFNTISVDGDTSTNDACVLCATGQSVVLTPEHPGWADFRAALNALARELAQAIVRDAEGATRFITLAVTGASDSIEARDVAFTVAHSPLVKTACYAGDPNWGRILAAVGRAPVAELDVARVAIALDDVAVITNGQPDDRYREASGARVMAQAEYTIHIDLGRGTAEATVWTSDLSHEYVRINADYRS